MSITIQTPELHRVLSKKATEEDDVFIMEVDITNMYGERYETKYCTRPDDTFGLNPTIRAWIDANPDFPITPYVPPTENEIRAAMQSISPRQLRLALVRSGISLSSVVAAIDALPEGQEKEEAQIEWEYATEYNRTAPALLAIAAAIGLTPIEVDELWTEALAI